MNQHNVRDRAVDAATEKRIRFTSNMLPLWARRSGGLDALLPVLYLRGVSMGDFQEALTALLGPDAPNLSPGVISPLTAGWQEDHDRWQRRDLSARRYVYIWTDRVYRQARMEPQAECMLVILGATPEGKKELVGFQIGVGESAQSWRELLVDLKARGLAVPPELAVGDGALGFWKAMDEVFPGTRHPASTVKRMRLTVSQDGKCAQLLTQGHAASCHRQATRDLPCQNPRHGIGGHQDLRGKYAAKYARGVTCLTNDNEALLAFYDFPAEHWSICAPPTCSRVSLPLFDTEPSVRRAHCRRRPRN